MDWTLEVVIVPVSDIDRSIAFYRDQVGFALDHDTKNEQMHVVQLTPRGSGSLDRVRRPALADRDGAGLAPGPAARGGRRHRGEGRARWAGRRSAASSWCSRPTTGGTFFGFSDPDGNTWAVQQLKVRGDKPLIRPRTGGRRFVARAREG
jgi:catechol 2,3-dioxygenase-like lactoylglutathione lyase family enzyme